MKKKLVSIFALACAACLALAMVGCGGGLRFVTGGESGTYYAYGTTLASYATNNADVKVGAMSGNGSKANIEALQGGDADIAFCQSDVLAYGYNGTNLFAESGAYTDFSIVGALYQEQVQIVTCDPSIKTVADLEGKVVSIGAAGSGVYFNAIDILDVYGLTEADIDPRYLDFASSTDGLKDGNIDAAFIVAGAPTTAIVDLMQSKDAFLVSLDQAHVNQLVAQSPFYAPATIAADVYGMANDTTTVAIMAVIIANDSVEADAIYKFTASIFDGAQNNVDGSGAPAHAKYLELDLATAASILDVPYHAGAAQYYAEQGITVPTK